MTKVSDDFIEAISKVNSYSNCKSMNESRYFLFWCYNLDLHNHDRCNTVAATDPRMDFRWSQIKVKVPNLTNVSKIPTDCNVESLTEMVNTMELNPSEFICKDCGCGFQSQGYLENHKEKKHGEISKPFECPECSKILRSKRNLADHIVKIHRTCKPCNETFETFEELNHHKKQHTTCSECSVDFKTKYKLDRHLKTH